jgi:plastocyanin
MLRRSISVVLVVSAALGFAACGSSNKDSSTSTAAPAATPTTADSGAGGGGSTVTVAADPSGQLAYDKKTLTAKAGSVTIDFTNDSSTPHNVTIEQGEKELGNTPTIQGSKATKTITLKAGTYSFYCSVPSHEAAGMKGTLTVQ